jgi:hypothetical protein
VFPAGETLAPLTANRELKSQDLTRAGERDRRAIRERAVHDLFEEAHRFASNFGEFPCADDPQPIHDAEVAARILEDSDLERRQCPRWDSSLLYRSTQVVKRFGE